MWKAIPTWKEYYVVSEYGEIKNLQTGKLLKGDINCADYQRVCLYNKPRKERFFRHRLVAQLFLENPNNYREVNHIDGDKNNNFFKILNGATGPIMSVKHAEQD